MAQAEQKVMTIDFGVLATFLTGLVLTDDTSALSEALDFLHQTKLHPLQYPRAYQDVSPIIREQFKHVLDEMPPTGTTEVKPVDWLRMGVEKFGDSFEIHPIPHVEELHRNPSVELLEMVLGEEDAKKLLAEGEAEGRTLASVSVLTPDGRVIVSTEEQKQDPALDAMLGSILAVMLDAVGPEEVAKVFAEALEQTKKKLGQESEQE